MILVHIYGMYIVETTVKHLHHCAKHHSYSCCNIHFSQFILEKNSISNIFNITFQNLFKFEFMLAMQVLFSPWLCTTNWFGSARLSDVLNNKRLRMHARTVNERLATQGILYKWGYIKDSTAHILKTFSIIFSANWNIKHFSLVEYLN